MSTIFDLEQTSHWYPLIWIFAAGIILYKMPKKQELVCGQMQERWYWFTAVLLVLPYVLWAGYRTGGGDTSSYAYFFHRASSSLAERDLSCSPRSYPREKEK